MIVRLSIPILFALSVALAAAPVSAQEAGCYYDGQLWPNGTRIGGLVCQDGQWVAG